MSLSRPSDKIGTESRAGDGRPAAITGTAFLGRHGHVLFVVLVLAFAVVARVILATRGGQHFFYDESNYEASLGAAAELSEGHVKSAILDTIEQRPGIIGNNFGFKLIGIVPALIEVRYPRRPQIPAIFFGMFSSLSVLILAAIARRLTGSRRAFDLTLIAAALSATLFAYSRFLLPYDLSMCVALFALWIGVRKPSGYSRSLAVGALAAWSFFCYYGYWPLAGAVIFLHALWQSRNTCRPCQAASAPPGSAGSPSWPPYSVSATSAMAGCSRTWLRWRHCRPASRPISGRA